MTDPVPTHPLRRTLRTVVQGLLTAAVLLPVAIAQLGLDLTDPRLAWLVGVLAVLAGFARLMALPAVEGVLQRYLPWLAAGPPNARHDDGGHVNDSLPVWIAAVGIIILVLIALFGRP